MLMLGTYSEDQTDAQGRADKSKDMRLKVEIVEKQIGFQLDFVRSADWHGGWGDVESDYTVKMIRDKLAPRHVQHMSVCFPAQYGKAGSRDGWRRLANGEFKENCKRSFRNKLRALPSTQALLFFSTSYETQGNFWFNDIQACGGQDAYIGAVRKMREWANEVENEPEFKGRKRIVLVHNPVNENGRTGAHADFAATFVPGSHGAIFINCYDKPQFQGGTRASVVDYWLNAYCGLNSIVALAKKHNVPWGMAEVGFGSDGRDISMLTRMVRDFYAANMTAGGGAAIFAPWPSDKDYPGNVYAGRSPRAAADLNALFQGLKALQKNAGTAPSPQPQPAPLPIPQPAPHPSTPKPAPAAPEADLLRRIHEGSYEERVRNPQTKLAPVEHIAWASRTGAADALPGMQALLAIYRALEDGDALSAAERAIAMPWMVEAEDILEAAGLLDDEPAPQPQEPSGEVKALREQIAALSQALEEQKAGRARAEAQLAAVRTALAL